MQNLIQIPCFQCCTTRFIQVKNQDPIAILVLFLSWGAPRPTLLISKNQTVTSSRDDIEDDTQNSYLYRSSTDTRDTVGTRLAIDTLCRVTLLIIAKPSGQSLGLNCIQR
ncbi:hypothetical protein PAXRUDRAFT_447657 [Paxillus rubicundulus Ve08.2h10]|uniref:Uncharacterized protein n=1 Tax=Paxillus rubicundulus Ve08.2h10 TaxID=930991 RepID=A0A0D0DWY6_9AGAM|nr:hypothetical protein PAXRUDRAFT_447657 [Paxillus rubicundulus Ve08.2h10]